MRINIEYKDIKFLLSILEKEIDKNRILCQEMVRTKEVNMEEYNETLDKLTRMRYISEVLNKV